MESDKNNIHAQALTAEDFNRLSNSVYSVCGINLPDVKKSLVEGRIRKRMKTLGMDNMKAYINYLFSDPGRDEELIPFIDVVTTNKTDFFREIAHFDYLAKTILPEFISANKSSAKRKTFQIWSAGCSTGEEPYTMAMLLNEFGNAEPSFKYEIYASDISTEVLAKASMGIFEMEKIDVIPEHLLKKYLMRSKDPSKQIVRFIPAIRSQINFSRINLMDENYALPDNLDVVFCRNVIIYFDKRTQQKVIANLVKKIHSGGYLLLGHSETIMGMQLPITRVASTIYKKY